MFDIIESVNSFISSLENEGIEHHAFGYDFKYRTDIINLQHLPDTYCVVKMRGDGLCWINSILGTIFGRFRKHPTILNKWVQDLLTTFAVYDDSFVFLFNIQERTIDFDSSELVDFLNRNMLLLCALAFNIISFCVKNYTNPQININCPIFNLDACVGINKNGGFSAIDNNMRNFIMNVCGVERVEVFQQKTESHFQRCNHVLNNTRMIIINNQYVGFQIESFGTINVGGYYGSIHLYTFNANHYDALCLDMEPHNTITAFFPSWNMPETEPKTEPKTEPEPETEPEPQTEPKTEPEFDLEIRRIEEACLAEEARRVQTYMTDTFDDSYDIAFINAVINACRD
jgi:hypothetical protein